MAIQYTPALRLPYPQVTDAPLIASRDLRALAQKMDSEGAQIRGESTSALTAAQAAEALAAQAMARAEKVEFPIESGTTPPEDEDKLWVDEGASGGEGTQVSAADITDATAVGRNILTAPLTVNARNALDIWTGTRALLDAGTDTAERTWDAKELHEYVTETAASAGGASSWDDLTGKPSTFPPAAHTHAQADVTGLETALAGKVDEDDPRLTDARTPLPHTHDDRYYTEAEVDAKVAVQSTGLRDITSDYPEVLVTGTQPGLALSRVGNLVQLSIYGARVPQADQSGTSHHNFSKWLPPGFRPLAGTLLMVPALQGSTATVRFRVVAAGQFTVYDHDGASSIYGSFTFSTADPWPSTLPGVPA